MRKAEYVFSSSTVTCLFDAAFRDIETVVRREKMIIITDENVYAAHKEKFASFPLIIIPAGEENKIQKTCDDVIRQLVDLEADRQSCIVGVGGGVVTDLVGYIAAVYKRGTRLVLVPTSILAMVDASIGGKNGIDVGVYKNMVGTTKQPDYIIFDYDFLDTLPVKEWINGFAEIIKHACIRDLLLFQMLERYTLHQIQSDKSLVADLIEKNAAIKMDIVTKDEFETGQRKLLNFGHTVGHAVENLHQLPHGHAVSIGMVAACNLSEKLNGFHFADAQRVVKLLAHYHLPVDIETDYQKVFSVLKMDKKREDGEMHFIMLSKIGEAEVVRVPLTYLQENLKTIL